ncbi:MAG: hypothetical protein JWN34_245 [Bryobacterales bacterium]|nr:hypothetical protein [Bryobacterales bacterium]
MKLRAIPSTVSGNMGNRHGRPTEPPRHSKRYVDSWLITANLDMG